MKANKMLGVTLLLMGLLHVVMGGGTLYLLAALSQLFSNPLFAAAAAGLAPYMAIGWVLGILQLVTGIMAAITAVLLFKEKK